MVGISRRKEGQTQPKRYHSLNRHHKGETTLKDAQGDPGTRGILSGVRYRPHLASFSYPKREDTASGRLVQIIFGGGYYRTHHLPSEV